MGHYASEMAASKPRKTGLEKSAEKRRDLQAEWDHKLNLLQSYHNPGSPVDKYTCPRCFAQVKYWFLADHDDWHVRLKASGGLFSAI